MMAEIRHKTIIELSDDDIVAIDCEPIKPQIVYHYTNIEVLKIILATQKLRLTNLRMLSDRSEYMHALNLLIKGVADYEYRLGIEPKYHIPQEFYDKLFFPDGLYVVCFTENGDDFNFWNSKYVGSVQPIAIGFQFNALRRDNIILNRCYYGDGLPAKVDSRIYNLIRNIYTCNYTQEEKYLFIHLTHELAHIKRKDFISENEWRFITPDASKIGVRSARQVRRDKYIFTDIALDSIAKIVVGGGENIPHNLRVVEGIVKQYNINPIIAPSTVPFYP